MTATRIARGARRPQFEEFARLGMTQKAIADFTGLPASAVSSYAKKFGLAFPNKRGEVCREQSAKASLRVPPMAALYRGGYTLAQIGEQYGITRERVRQLLRKYSDVRAGNGGAALRTETRRRRREAERDAQCLKSRGMVWADYAKLLEMGRAARRAGSPSRGPILAFIHQRNASHHRGIGWELSLAQWWAIWQSSGRWDERGRGGYVMCRKGDVGPYAVDNVFIATSAQNASEGRRHAKVDPSLPIGVRRAKSGRYLSIRSVNGKKLRLGTHDTPELAYAAYLMAGQAQRSAA